MGICEVLGRNTAVVVIRLSSFSGSSEKDILEYPIDLNEDKRTESFEFKETEWEVSFDINEADRYRDIYDLSIELKLKKGEINDLCISVAMKFHGFEENNFLFVPSTFYGKVVEGTCLNSSQLYVTSREKQVNLRGKYIDVADCSIPCLGFFNPSKKNAFLLGFNRDELEGFEGIGFMEMADKKLCEFMLCIPYRNLPDTEEYKLHKNSYNRLIHGEPLKISAKLVFEPCKDLGTFYNIYFDVIPVNFTNQNMKNMNLSYGTEQLDNTILEKDSSIRRSAINSLISILNGDESDMAFSADVLDDLMSGINLKGISLEKEDSKRLPEGGLYELGDLEATYFLCKSLLYLNKIDDRLIKDKWSKDASAFGEEFKDFVDVEIIPYLKSKMEADSNNYTICTSICILPAALTCLGLFSNDEKLLSKAVEVAKMLYTLSFDSKVFITGFPDEVWSYMLMESFVTIYEASSEKEWLEKAVAASSLFSTWHLKCDYSGNALFRMFLYTEDLRYVNILKHTLQMGCKGKQLGRIGEQESKVPTSQGINNEESAWKALSYLEVPGLYVNSKEGLVASFGTIDAKVLDRREGKLRVVVTNPDSRNAKIRTMIDRSRASAFDEKYYIPKYMEMNFQPGETKVLSF